MSKYDSDSSGTIHEVFSLEGDALERHGFTMPDIAPKPEEYEKAMAQIAAKEQQPEVING